MTLFSTIISLETTIVVFQILARRIKSLTFINKLILSLNAEIIIQESGTLRLQLGIPSFKSLYARQQIHSGHIENMNMITLLHL